MRERRALLVASIVLAGCGDDTSSATEGGGGSTGAAPVSSTGEPASTGGDAPTGGGSTGGGDDTTGAPGTTGGDETSGTTGEPAIDGHFIAVGDGGVRARSVDGEMWETQVGSGMIDLDSDMAPPDALRALALGDGFVIAVGGGGNFFTGNAMVMRSDDGGASWQENLLAMPDGFQPHKLYGVAYASGVLVAAGMRGKLLRSEDGGFAWTELPSPDTNARMHAVAAAGDTFVVVGWTEDAYDAPKTSIVVTSADKGLTWSPPDESFERLDDIAHGNGTFVAVGPTECIRSSDGLAWSDCGLVSEEYQAVEFTRGEFVAVTLEGLATSADGIEWSEPVTPPFGAPTDLAHGNGRYVGVRWTDRGWADDLGAWSFAAYATQPTRALLFVPSG